jgi:hypothetical protein
MSEETGNQTSSVPGGKAAMAEVEDNLFTIGVFPDLAWAERGIEALTRQGFAPDSMSLLAKDSPDTAALVEKATGTAPERLELPTVGRVVARGELLGVLQGDVRDLSRIGLAAAMRRAGFQPHDGLIFETLTGNGGVLVAVHGAPRAADALAVMLNHGGGNASIGAWAGRL